MPVAASAPGRADQLKQVKGDRPDWGLVLGLKTLYCKKKFHIMKHKTNRCKWDSMLQENTMDTQEKHIFR